MTPRFEFRVFGDGLRAQWESLDTRAVAPEDDEPRTDVYFVVRGRVDASLKLRGGKLDLKLFRGETDGLELWEPVAEAGLPVHLETLRRRFLGPAGVSIELTDAPVDRDLLLAMAAAAPETRIVPVEKHRRRYRLSGVAAEVTRLSIDGCPAESMAVEGADRERTMAAVTELGMSGRQNTSYQRLLVGMLFAPTGRAITSPPGAPRQITTASAPEPAETRDGARSRHRSASN